MLDVIYTQYMKKFQSQDEPSWLHPTSEINTRNQGHLDLVNAGSPQSHLILRLRLNFFFSCCAVPASPHSLFGWTCNLELDREVPK